MRSRTFTAAVAIVALVVAGGAGAAEPRVAAGSARLDDKNGASRHFSFSAARTQGKRAATGWASIDYAAGPKLRMTITCMRVIGKRAVFAGKVRSATVRAHVGQTAVFVIEDGGPPLRDLITLVYIAEPGQKPYTCLNFPPGMVLLKPSAGAVRIGPSKAETA